MGTDQTKFLPALDGLKLSKAEWDELANHYRNAPTGSTYQFKFDNIEKAKKFLRDTFIERHAAENKRAVIERLTKWPGQDGAQASPMASAPGLAANSTQQQTPDDGVMSILKRYGLAD